MGVRERLRDTRTFSPLTCLSMTEVWLPIRADPIKENTASLAVASAVARAPRRPGADLAELLVESTGSNKAKSELLCPSTAPAPSNSSALRHPATATNSGIVDLFTVAPALLFNGEISFRFAVSITYNFLSLLLSCFMLCYGLALIRPYRIDCA